MSGMKSRKIPQQLFTRRQAAEILGIGIYRLDRLEKSGTGPRPSKLGDKTLYSRKALQGLLD